MGVRFVIDACSILDFQKYYIFDKLNGGIVYSKLIGFLLSKVKFGEIIIIDKVYNEIYTTKYTKSLKSAVKPYIVDTLFLFPEVEKLIKNNTRNDVIDLFELSKSQIEYKLRKYEDQHADLYMIAYCEFLKKKKIESILITEETFNNDKKIIEKIPTICKKEKIEFRKVPYFLFDIYKDELKFKLDLEIQ
ncbi:MAG: DUF4411 family protein [DPANN group archaeon]|nr:DUF4411 family protein [DPANN group archaeon]